MKVIYPYHAHFKFSEDGNIYLAGENNNSWKKEALAYLEDHQFRGNVFLSNIDYVDDESRGFQVLIGDFTCSWHNYVAHNCDVIVYWSDFEIPFRYRLDQFLSRKVILGSFKHSQFHSVDGLMEEALRRVPVKEEKRFCLERNINRKN